MNKIDELKTLISEYESLKNVNEANSKNPQIFAKFSNASNRLIVSLQDTINQVKQDKTTAFSKLTNK